MSAWSGRVDAADAVAVELGVPDHPVDRRVIEPVGRDAARLALAAGLDLSGFKEVILLPLECLRVQAEDRVAAGIGVPDVAVRIFRIDAQGVRPRAAFGRKRGWTLTCY